MTIVKVQSSPCKPYVNPLPRAIDNEGSVLEKDNFPNTFSVLDIPLGSYFTPQLFIWMEQLNSDDDKKY